MDRLGGILTDRREELVGLLVLREGFDERTARRFVEVAVDDLVESYRWQGERPRSDPSAVADARRLLGFVHGNAIASAVGVPTPHVWRALRTLVPHLLALVGGQEPLEQSA